MSTQVSGIPHVPTNSPGEDVIPTKSTVKDVDTQFVQSNAEILASIQNKQKHDLFTNDSLSFCDMKQWRISFNLSVLGNDL